MSRCDRAWLQELRSASAPARDEALADLRDYLRMTLARGFGRQLNDADLDDLTQESLVRILERLDSFEERSRFTTWAASIAVHAAISELRRRRYRHIAIEDAVEQGAASLVQDDGHARAESDEILLHRGIVEGLTERQRQVILGFLGGLPLMEMARRLGTTQGAIYKLLHDARNRLRVYLTAAGASIDGVATTIGTGK